MVDLISASEFIEIADELGHRITKNQLARWRREGLLSGVRREFPGRGSVSHYRKSEVSQALEIARLLTKNENFTWIGWHLWVQGYEVQDRLWRPHLRKAFNQIDKVSKLGRKVSELTDRKWLRLTKNVWLAKPAPSAFKRSRKAVGQADFSDFLDFVLRIAGGEFCGLSTHPELNDKDRVQGARVLDRATGLRGAREHYVPEEEPWLNGDVSPELCDLSDAFHAHGNRAFVGQLSLQSIIEARDEFFLLRRTVLNKHAVLSHLSGNPHAFGFRVIAAILSNTSIRIQAALLAGWTIARTSSTLGANTKRWLNENTVFNDPAIKLQVDASIRLGRRTEIFPYGKRFSST